MSPSFFLRQLARECRGALPRLLFFTACLAVGVAGVVAVAGLAAGIEQGIRSGARDLLAADLIVEGRRPLPPELDGAVASLGRARSATIKLIATVVAAPPRGSTPGRSLLVNLKAVDGGYPFYGKLLLDPDRPLQELLGPASVVVAPEVLHRLDRGIGDTIRIGGVDFDIAGTVLEEPDRMDIGLSLGPRVFLSARGLERTELEGFGSLIRYQRLIRLEGDAGASRARAVADSLRRSLPGAAFLRIHSFAEAQPGLRSALRRAERFLGLVALLSLLVGGIGVAQAVRAWLAGRRDAIAVLKSLGVRPREILALYLGQTLLLGLAGSLTGVLAGSLLQAALPWMLPDVARLPLEGPFQPMAALRGVALGLAVSVLFSLPPLLGIRRVSPARVFRSEARPLGGSPLAWCGAWGVLLAGVTMMAGVQSGSTRQGLLFVSAIAAVLGLLTLSASGLSRLVAKVPRGAARVWVRHGLAALSRPGAGTLSAIVALGMGVLVVLSMYLVERRLSQQLSAQLPTRAPAAYLVDIQPSQWEGVRRLLERSGATRIESVAVTMARLAAVEGTPVKDLLASTPEHGRAHWIYRREQRLTSMEKLPEDNVLIEGKLWSDPAKNEISLERQFAEDLGVHLGSVLSFDIQGVPLDLEVTSLRDIEWRGLGLNFLMVVEPGVLEKAPQFRIAAIHLPAAAEQITQDRLAEAFPNVTYLRVREILEKLAALV
ncbi:MAG: ABC transporter permease, partial [Acidobacteriota bacterium]